MAKDEYTFTFLKGSTQSTGATSGKSRAQAGDAALKGFLRSFEKILKDTSKEGSEKYAKSLERIFTKFAKPQSQTKGTAASGGINKAEISAIFREAANEFVKQQLRQLAKSYSSGPSTEQSNNKIIDAINKSADRQAKTVVSSLLPVLAKRGIYVEDTKNLERAVAGAMKKAIPTDTGVAIKEIGKTTAILRSSIGEINKIVRSVSTLRKSGGGIDVKEIKEAMKSFGQLNKNFKQISESTVKAGKAIGSVTDEVSDFKKSLSDFKKAAATKVRGVRTRAENDPVKFAKITATAIGQTLEKTLKKSPSFKGSELESNIKKLDKGVKNIGDVLNKFKKIQSDITTAAKKGQISIDTKAIENLSKNLSKLPKSIGIDINTKGWKDLSKGLENFSKTTNVIINSLKKLKVTVDVDTKPVEVKIEKAISQSVQKGFGGIKAITKEIDTSFNKIISEMRKMYVALPKESPIRPKLEKAGKELKAAKEKGDYGYISKRIGGMQNVIKAPELNKAIKELRGAIVELTSELKGAGIDDLAAAFSEITGDIKTTKIQEKFKKSGKAVDNLTKSIEDKTKEFNKSRDSIKGFEGIKFLQETSRVFSEKMIEPGKKFKLKGTDIGYGADVRKAVKEKADSLAQSLEGLEKDIVSTLEKGRAFTNKDFGWKVLNKKFENIGQQWTVQIAKIGGDEGIEAMLKKIDTSYVKMKDPKAIIERYRQKRKTQIAETVKQIEARADNIGKWLIQRDEDDIDTLFEAKSITETTRGVLKEVKNKYKGTEVGKEMRKELTDKLGDSLKDVFKETFAAEQVKRELTSGDFPKVTRVAVPAASISKTGTAIFKTKYGTERALPKFATYKSGFEELYEIMSKQKAMVNEQALKFGDEIESIGMKPATGNIAKARNVSQQMLSVLAQTGPEQLKLVIDQYKEAATMVGAKRQEAGLGSISSYENKISTGIKEFKDKYKDIPKVFDEFVKEMEDLGISAYDVVKSLESIKFENVYDVYRKVIKGSQVFGKGGKTGFAGPLSKPIGKRGGLAEYPQKSTLRAFDQAVAQVEQLMPIIEKSKVKRGKHQEEVTTTFFQTSPIYKGMKKEFSSDQAAKQRKNILDMNMNLKEMFKEYESLAAEGEKMSEQSAKRFKKFASIPRGIKTISTLGPPEEQASKYKEFRTGAFSEKSKALAPLESTAIKLYTEKLLDQAPFGEFSRLGKQIGYVNSAMSSLSKEANKVFGVAGVTTETPKFRTTRERDIISSGRYGTTGYGFNVIAELKHSANTFEDQIVVSGGLAKALTQAVSTLVRPGPKGRLGELGGAHVTDIKKGQVLRDITSKDIENVSKEFMKIFGVPEQYKKEADKALIENVKKEIVSIRGKDVEVQKAQLAEVFMNYFGRKFTTRYGSKGVSVSPAGKEDLGVAKIPKSMGQLASEILGKLEKEGKTPKFGKLKNIESMQNNLIESGNKFIISMFSDASDQVAKGLGVPEEIAKQAKVYKAFTSLIKRVYGEELPKDIEGIKALKGLYKTEVGGKLYTEKPIDIRISARGAIKRGLQPEFIETMMGNLIGAGAGKTTVQPKIGKATYEKILGTKGQRGLLSKYSKTLGFEGAGVPKKQIEKELFATYKAAGKTDEEAKVMAERAAAFEAQANYYTTVKNEYGKAVKSIVGPKFVQIIEEPHENEKWTARGVKELKKAAKINLAAYSAYAGVFGEKSPLMKQIREATTLESKKQFEYIKALEALAVKGPGKEMSANLIKSVKEVSLKELKGFEPRTGTYSEKDLSRSLRGTVLDLEKYPSEFKVNLPTKKGPKGELEKKPFYIPGALARQTYPEKLIAGEYGMDDVSRYLQIVINRAKEVEDSFAGKGNVKDVYNTIKKKIIEDIKKAKIGGSQTKQKVFEKFWKGLKNVEVAPEFRAEAELPTGTTETKYVKTFFDKWAAQYSQTAGKTRDDAVMLTIRRMGDILIGAGKKSRGDLQKAKPRIAKESEAGTLQNFAKQMDIDLSDSEAVNKKLELLRNAKVDYMHALAKSLVGKSGAIQSAFFERKAPAVIGKATTAVVDRTAELEAFGETLKKLSKEAGFEKYINAFGEIADTIDEIGKEHKDIISRYKKQGIPVLKQGELGIPESIAKKIPVSFEKRYEIQSGTPILTGKTKRESTVDSNLYKMLEYKGKLEKGLSKVAIKSDYQDIKSFIDKELQPYLETVRFPITGVSSLQPYKAKVLKEEQYPKSKFSYAVPGVPEMRMASEEGKKGFVEVINKFEKIKDDFVKAREELQTTADTSGTQVDPNRVADLTKKIEMLDKAISDVIPKYTAIQQKLDFDGDEIEAHSGTLSAAREDIKKHYEALNKGTNSIENAWRQVRGFEEVAPGATSQRFPFADLLTYFESKWDPSKGYEFLKKPELTQRLDFLKPGKQLDILSAVGGDKKSPSQLLKEVTEKQITSSKGREEVFKIIDNSINEGNNTSKDLLSAIKTLNPEFSKLIEVGIKNTLSQEKYKDAIIGQLYKLHTGQEVEAIYRLQRIVEARMGFGGGMIGAAGGGGPDYRTAASDTFRKRWPKGMKISGRLSPESEISTFMNELSRFAQQKGMDVKLAGEKPVGGEITMLLGQGVEGVNTLLEKIGIAGNQADDDYSQLKDFADTSSKVIEKRLGTLPTDVIKKEVSGLRSARGMPEISMSTRKEAVDEAVRLIGLEGFLRELSQQIEEDAVEALVAKLKSMSPNQRSKTMGSQAHLPLKEYAEKQIEASEKIGKKSPTGISTTQIMSQRAPLYKFRGFGTSPTSIAGSYAETYGKIEAPRSLKGYRATKYEEAQAVATSIGRSLKEAGQTKAGGAYNDLVLSAIDNMYKEQERREYKLNELKKQGYDIGVKREVSDIPKRLFEEGMPDIPEFIRSLVNPSDAAAGSLKKLKKEIDSISLLAGVPPLSAETKKRIKIEMPALGEFASSKYPEVSGETKDDTIKREQKINEFTDVLVQKAQAVAQLDRAIASIVASKGFETKLLPPKDLVRKALTEELQSTIKAPIRPISTGVSPTKEFKDQVEKATSTFYEKSKEKPQMPNIYGPSGPGGGGPGAFAGRMNNEIVRVHIQSVEPGVSLSFDSPEAIGGAIEHRKTQNRLKSLRKLQEKSAGVTPTLEETYKNVYRASALSAGGIYESAGPKKQQQIEAIKKYMLTGTKKIPPEAEATSFTGTIIHKKEQDRLSKELETKSGGKERYDVERYVKFVSPIAKTITGHVDLIKQKLNEDTQKYVDEKIVDIKTVSSEMVKRFKELGVESFSDLGKLKKEGGLTKYDIQKLEDTASQINLYIAAIAQANNVAAKSLKGEAWFYDRKDIKNIAKIKINFDPKMLKRDMTAISESRKSIISEYGADAFAKATHVLDLEKAEAKRQAGKEPLTGKEWKKFEKLSKQHTKTFELKGRPSYREEDVVKPPLITQEKVLADSIAQRARFEQYTIPETPIMGEGVYNQLENLKRAHQSAKEYQMRSKGIDVEKVGDDLNEHLAKLVKEVKETGPMGEKFGSMIEDLKFAGMIGGGEITKAWKYYRIALGDFFIKQAEEAKSLEADLTQQGKLGAARTAYHQAENTINDMKSRISQGLGKPSDIYTSMRRYVSPDLMKQLGLYSTPEQLLVKSKGALGDDTKTEKIFKKTIVGDVMKGGKLTSPIEKVRAAVQGISNLDKKMVETLTDADKFKKAGPEILNAWDFDRLTERVTKLRVSLQTFLRFRLQEDADAVGRKNLEDTLNLLKNLENQYSSFGRVQKKGLAGWGEMGLVKVPKFLEPRQQEAMNMRNIQKVREYFKKTTEEGGPKAGERYTYSAKVIGEAGDTVKNVAFDFKKYGDALNFAGEKTGVFSEKQRDIFKLMQEGGQTFRSAIMRAVRWGAASRIVYGGWQKLGDSIRLLADIETGMANLRMVMSPLETDFGGLQKAAIGFAKQYGVPMTDVLKSMKIFAQQGLQQGEVVDRTKTATLASNVTTLSAKEATEALTAAMKVFRQEGESSLRFMDAWSEVEAKHAITSGDMANALKKAASAGKNAGFTFDELNGVIAAIGSVTRQTGKEVGTAMRFIFRRLTSEKAPKELAKIGIPVLTGTGELRKGFDVLNDLSKSWKDLTSAQKMNIAQAIGGTRQYNALLVLMDNWNEALSAIKDSTNSKGSAERRNLEIMKTFTKQMEQMKAAATEVYMSFGKITFPIAKAGLKGLKFLLESFTEIPGVIKAAMIAVSGFFIYMSKGADIIDYFFNRWRGGKSIVGNVIHGISKEWKTGMAELFGIGTIEEGIKTIGKNKKIKIPTGIFDVTPEGVASERIIEKLIPQGKTLKDFHSVLGKTTLLIKETGMAYNSFVGDMLKTGGNITKDIGGPFDYVGKKLLWLSSLFKKGFNITGGTTALITAFETGGISALATAIPTAVMGVATIASKAAGDTSKAVAKVADFAGQKFGKAGESFVNKFASENTGMVKALAPLGVSLIAIYPAIKGLTEYYIKATQSAQDYEKSMYGASRANESQLKGVRDLIGSYAGLERVLADAKKVSAPDVKKRRQELGTYESPLLTMESVIKKSRNLSNNLADSNVNLVAGYDKFGNAILNVTGNIKEYLKVLEKVKVKEGAKIEIDIAAKFITDLTQIEGPEKWKSALKNLLKEAPGFGEVLAKGIKLSPAKAMDMVTERLNNLLALKKKFPMSTSFDKDIKKYQNNLKTVRSGFRETYSDFRRVLSDIETKGLNRNEIAKLLGTKELRKGYELMIDIEPRFNLKETKGKVEWQDVLGAEVMKRAFPSFAATFDASKALTKARLETAGAVQRQGKAVSGDIAFFMDDASKKYGIAGDQAIVSLKETTDGVFEWFVTYFNNKTLKIEEKPFTKDLQNMVESIFPKNRIEAELSDRIKSLNEFTAGASAGLRGLSAKDFKRSFGLGERFFSEIPTTTILQGPKGYAPAATGKTTAFGVSPFQKDWKDTTEEFFFKPMREYRLKAEQLQKLQLEGLQGGEVTLAKGLYEELTKLQNILKNNQVVLQYRAVFVDLTKTIEAGTRALQENLAIEKSRLKLRTGTSGYLKGVSEGLDNLDLGVQKFSDLTVKQRALLGGKGYRAGAVRFNELQTKRTAKEEQIYGIDRALVALENIRQVSKGFGASLSSEDMKKYTEIIAKTDDTGAQSIAIETSKVVDNTADTVDRLDNILENMGDPDAILKSLENVGELSPGRIVNKMERVARIRDKNLESGNKDIVISSNKSLDLLSSSLVEQVGIKKAMSMVENNYSLLSDKAFKPEEFTQRAFGGADFKQFVSGMKENLPQQRSFFKRFFGIGRDLSGFKDEIKPLTKLQEKNNQDQWVSSKNMAKMSAAMSTYAGLNKYQSRDTIAALEKQRSIYKPGTEERKNLEARIVKEKKGSLAEGKVGEESWKAAQALSGLTAGVTLFGKELGLTESQIKKLTAAVVGLYGVTEYVGKKKEGKQAGGLITGPGGPKDDNIQIDASSGEYVIKASSVKGVGKDKLDYMNKYGKLPGFQKGGLVDSKTYKKQRDTLDPILTDPTISKILNQFGIKRKKGALEKLIDKIKEIEGSIIIDEEPRNIDIVKTFPQLEKYLKYLPDVKKYQTGGIVDPQKIEQHMKKFAEAIGTDPKKIKIDTKFLEKVEETRRKAAKLPKKFWVKQSGGSIDNIPIKVSNGEYIVNKQMAKKLGYNRLDYMNKYGELPGFQEGGVVGATATTPPPTNKNITVNIGDQSLLKLKNLLLPYLAATTAGYVAQRTEDKTRLSTLNAQAKKEAELFVEIVKKYPDAAQKMIDARKQIANESKKIKPIPTTTKSLVMDTEKERKKIVGDLSKVREDIIKQHEKEVEELSKVSDKLAKLEIATKFKMELEEMKKVISEINIASDLKTNLEKSLITVKKDLSGIREQFRFPESMNKLTGKYKPQPVNYGVRGVSGMTPEEYLSYSNKRITSTSMKSKYFFSTDRAGKVFKDLETNQKKKDIKESKLIEYISRKEELKGRKGSLSAAESEELKSLNVIIKNLSTGLEDLTVDIEAAKNVLKKELEDAADTIRRRTTAFDALKGLENFNADRMFGQKAILNKNLVGFGGGYELPTGKKQMSTQQRIFTDATDEFNKSATEYAYRLNTLIPSMRQNMSEIADLRRQALEQGDTDRYDALTKQLYTAKEAMDKITESTRTMGEALSVVNRFAEVMYKFKDAIADIRIQESVENLKGFKGFKESMDKVFGGAHPLAPVTVSPEEQRKAAQVGIGLRDMRSNRFDKMQAEALYQIAHSKGAQYREAAQRYADIPNIKAREIERYNQRKEVAVLQRQAAPFENILQMLQRLAVSKNITPERRQEVEKLRDAIANAIDGFGDMLTQQEKLNELAKNRSMFTNKEYTARVKQIKEGAPEQYRGLTAFNVKGIMAEFGAGFEKVQTDVSSSGNNLADVFGKNIGDVVKKQDVQIDLLKQIAQKGFGFTPTEFGQKPKLQTQWPEEKFIKDFFNFIGGTGSSGKKIAGRYTGGQIFGAGGPREDKVPAMLSPGEYVVRAASAQRLGYDTLEHMNKKGEIPKFQAGGVAKKFTIDPEGYSYTAISDEMKKRIVEQKKKERKKPIVEKPAVRLIKKTKIGQTLEDRRKMLEESLKYSEGGMTDFKINPKTDKTLSSIGLFMSSQMNPESKLKTSLDEIMAEVGGLQKSKLSDIMDNMDKAMQLKLMNLLGSEKRKFGGFSKEDFDKMLKFADGGTQAYKILPYTGVSFPIEEKPIEEKSIEKKSMLQKIVGKLINKRPDPSILGFGTASRAGEQLLKERKYFEELRNKLGFAGGGAVEKLKAIGMSEEEIKRELGGIEQPLLDPIDIIGIAAGVSKLAFGLGKGVVKQAAKKVISPNDILKVVESTKSNMTGKAYELGKMMYKNPSAKEAWKIAQKEFDIKTKAFGSVKDLSKEMFNEYGEHVMRGQFFREADEFASVLVNPSVKNSATKSARAFLEGKKDIADFAFESGGRVLYGSKEAMDSEQKKWWERDPKTGKLKYRREASKKERTPLGDFTREALWVPITPKIDEGKMVEDKILKETSTYKPLKSESFKGGLENRPAQKAATPKEALEWRKAHRKRQEKIKSMQTPREDEKVRHFEGSPTGIEELTQEQYNKAHLLGKWTPEKKIKYNIDDKKWKDDPKSKAWINAVSEARNRGVEDTEIFKVKTTEEIKKLVAEVPKAGPAFTPFIKPLTPAFEPFFKPFVKTNENEQKIKESLKQVTPEIETKNITKAISTTFKDVREKINKEVQPTNMLFGTKRIPKEKEKLAKGLGPPLPAAKTFEKARKAIERDAFSQAKARAAQAAGDKFQPVVGQTIRVKPTKAEDINFRGYEIPNKKTYKAIEAIRPGKTEGTDLYALKEIQRKLKFIAEHREEAINLLDQEEKDKFDIYYESKVKRSNQLISTLQSGKQLSDTKKWDPEYKRTTFPDLDKYSKLRRDMDASFGPIYDRLTIGKVAKQYKDVPNLGTLFSNTQTKIIDLINKGQSAQAKKVYDNAIEERQETLKKLSPNERARYAVIAAGGSAKSFSADLEAIRLNTKLNKAKAAAKYSGKTNDELSKVLHKIFPEMSTDEEIISALSGADKNYIKRRISRANLTKTESKTLNTHTSKPTGETKHHGGEIKKTGHVFMQKGEVVYPKAFAEGGPVYGELAKETTAQSLNGTMEIKVNASALDDAIKRLESMELKVEDKTIELPDFPKLEVDTDNVNIVVDGDVAASKIQAAVENINIDINSIGAVGAEELKNTSEQLEDRINSLNLNVEDIQNELKIITAPNGDAADINTLITAKVNEYSSEVSTRINEVRTDIHNLESRVSQNQNRIDVTTDELDRKIKNLQTTTGRGAF